ncbi:hypothetical protein [Saccharopolyspora pogona]|uniref:hypothetical protein n=1 Tax=Saccharopolyspora pogona TaxID=333966 RepID=UPI0016863409|nr:hypothetical protein [Saccharopolyspora pogona]
MKRRARMLTPDAYDTACDLAGDALLQRVPAAASVLQVTDDKVWSGFSSAVYITADSSNTIRYVGSALRTGPVSDRIQEHVLAGRADMWIRLMVVPLHADTEKVLVRKIEGRIGMVLRPLDNMRLPSLGRGRTKLRVR